MKGVIETEGAVKVKKNPVFLDAELDKLMRDKHKAEFKKSGKLPAVMTEKDGYQIVSREKKEDIRQQALAIYEELSAELDVYVAPKYNKPNTWSYYSAGELQRGDALQIDGVIYVYLHKLAWWRSKTANILVAQHHNPDKQKRIGEVDFVYAYKGYVRDQQLEKMGVPI